MTTAKFMTGLEGDLDHGRLAQESRNEICCEKELATEAGAKRIYILIITVNKLFSQLRCFLKEIFSRFLSSYRITRESLGELEKAVETLASRSCSHSISRSPKHPLVFL